MITNIFCSQILQQWVVSIWASDVGYVNRPLSIYLSGVAFMAAAVAVIKINSISDLLYYYERSADNLVLHLVKNLHRRAFRDGCKSINSPGHDYECNGSTSWIFR